MLDQETARILLVRNRDASFWYPPGGGWVPEKETLEGCAARETKEETGVETHILRLLYVQEFDPGNGDRHLELFWLATPTGVTELGPVDDTEGIVEESKWFSREELQSIELFPRRLKDRFWNDLSAALAVPNPFIK